MGKCGFQIEMIVCQLWFEISIWKIIQTMFIVKSKEWSKYLSYVVFWSYFLIHNTRNFIHSTVYPKQMYLSYVSITTAVFQTYVSRKSQKNALRHCNYVWKQCCYIKNKIWHLHFTHKKIKFGNLELRL